MLHVKHLPSWTEAIYSLPAQLIPTTIGWSWAFVNILQEKIRKGMLEWKAEKEGKCKHKTCSWISGRGASGIPKQIANKECVDVKMSNIWAGKHISRENKLNFALSVRLMKFIVSVLRLHLGISPFFARTSSRTKGFKAFSTAPRFVASSSVIVIEFRRKGFAFVCRAIRRISADGDEMMKGP